MISIERDIEKSVSTLNKENLEIFIISIICIFSFNFYFFDPCFSVFGRIIKTIILYSFVFILLFLEDFKIRITLPLILLFIYLFIYNYSGIFSNIDFSYKDIFFSSAHLLLFFAILYKRMNGNIFLKVFEYVIFIFILLNFLSLFFYILIFFNINVPYELINLGGRGFLYRNYFNLAIFNDYSVYLAGPFKVLRLCGMFEEPGMLGTYAGILLAFDFIFFPKKKSRKIILVIYGLLSLSMAFLIFLTFIFLYLLHEKSAKTIIVILIFILLIVLFLPIELKSVFQSVVAERFLIDKETLRFKGDNRYTVYYKAFQNYIRYDVNTFQFLFGNGKCTNVKEVRFASFARYIYEAGYIGFLIMITFLAYFLIYKPIKYNKINILLLTILPILSIYQSRGDISFDIVLCIFCLDYKLKMISVRKI